MNVHGLAESVSPETWQTIGFALDVLLKGLLILALASATVLALRRASAAVRHWCGAWRKREPWPA